MKHCRNLALFLVPFLLIALAGSCRRQNSTPPRFSQPIVFKINGSSRAVGQYAGVIQQQLAVIGVPVTIDALERNTLLEQMRQGSFQLATGSWIGGNQDPIFLKDLFGTTGYANRGKYSNPQVDQILTQAVATSDRAQAKTLYAQAQQMLSDEVPNFPLWYSENMIVARRDVENVKPDASGDMSFLAQVTTSPRTEPFVLAFENEIGTINSLNGTDGQSERLRQLMHRSLVKKNDQFDYVGDLAADIQTSPDNQTITFNLRDGVTFHDGRLLTAADAKYTLETLLASDSNKAKPFVDEKDKKPYIAGIEAPNPKTLVIKLRSPWLQLLSNLVPIPIVPQGSAPQQKDKPLGCGPFKFLSYDNTNKIVELEAFDKYAGGAPAIKKLRIKTIIDAGTLQAELKSGRVDLVSNAISLTPDVYPTLKQDPNLKVLQFPGANIVYLLFNAQSAPLNDKRVRQAIAYAIDRESIVKNLLLNQARVAHSFLPESSWAYNPGTKYTYDPAKAKQILDDAGFVAK